MKRQRTWGVTSLLACLPLLRRLLSFPRSRVVHGLLRYAFVGWLCVGACSERTNSENKGTPPVRTTVVKAGKSPALQAQIIYETRCRTCHGATGRGDGPSAAHLTPKPRDYSNADWQRSVTDEEIRQIILQGGMGTGKSPTMPAQADLVEKPEIVAELVKIIRGFVRRSKDAPLPPK